MVVVGWLVGWLVGERNVNLAMLSELGGGMMPAARHLPPAMAV